MLLFSIGKTSLAGTLISAIMLSIRLGCDSS
jgi:hypothetical protein